MALGVMLLYFCKGIADRPHCKHHILVPYRNREKSLGIFLDYMTDNLPATVCVIVIEQKETRSFERAWLLNVGLDYISPDRDGEEPQCVIFHDCDMIPKTPVDYTACKNPKVMGNRFESFNWGIPYNTYAGGVLSMHYQDWKKINGGSNLFKGWGGEDDDIFRRLKLYGFTNGNKMRYNTATYVSTEHSKHHLKRDRSHHNENLKLLSKKTTHERVQSDGLSNVQYEVVDEHRISDRVLHVQVQHKLVREPQTWLKINFEGRLGNNMFQLASAIGLSKLHNKLLCVPNSKIKSSLDAIFKTSLPPECPPDVQFVKETEKGYGKHQVFIANGNTEIGTYLQSWKYFHSVEKIIKRTFCFQPHLYLEARRLSPKKKFRDGHLIGIHVRRGDHITEYHYLNFPSDDYFEGIFVKFPESHVLVVSEDIPWCKTYDVFKKYNKRIYFQDKKVPPAVDMILLSMCDVVVLTMGTFGWWGAFFSEGQVIYNPNEFVMSDAVNKGNVIKEDYYPAQWKVLDNRNRERRAHIMTTNTSTPRYMYSKKTLQKVGFSKIIPIDPIKYGNGDELSKVMSNKKTFLYSLEKFIDDRDEWLYIFEDDIDAHNDVSMKDILELEKKSVLFFYLGICFPIGKITHTPHSCGRCAHAMAFSKKGARELLEFEKTSTKKLQTRNIARNEPYFDVIIEGWCNENGKFNVLKQNKISPENIGHRGAFFQARKLFPSTISLSFSHKLIKGEDNPNTVCIIDDFWVTKMKTTKDRGLSITPKLHSKISTTCNHLHKSNSVLWIAGAPGAGKSTITKRFQEYGFTVLDCEDDWAKGSFKKLLSATQHALKTRTTVIFAACYEHFLTKSPDRVIPVLLLPSHSVYTDRWKTRRPTDNQPHEARYAASIEVAKKPRVLVIKQPEKECVDKTVLRICTDSMIKDTND